jgi:hypothetical protein
MNYPRAYARGIKAPQTAKLFAPHLNAGKRLHLRAYARSIGARIKNSATNNAEFFIGENYTSFTISSQGNPSRPKCP